MANVKSQLTLEDKMSSTLSSITKAMHSTLTAMRSVKGVKLGPEFAKAASDIKLAENNINSLTKQVNQMSNSMNRGTSSTGSFLKGLIGFDLIKGAFSTITGQLDSAINRFDTINNYSNVMSSLGFGAEESQASIERLKEGLDGIPTTLDSAVTSVQRFASANENIGASTEMYLALNDAILAGGAQLPAQQAALEQVTQAYSKGKFEANEWKTMLIAMPAQLKQVAKEMGYTSTAVGGDFYNALQNGKISMNDMMKTMTELDSKTGGFHDQALKATNGIQTAIANAKTAITKGLVDMIDNANKALESAGLPTIQQIITNIGKTIQNAISWVGAAMGQIISYLVPVINAIKAVGTFIKSNWDIIAPILGSIIAMILVYKTITLVASIATGIWTAAQWALNVALTMNPIGLIILAIVALIGIIFVIVGVINHVTGSSISAIGLIMGAIYTLGAFIFNTFILPVWNSLAMLVNFFANCFKNPVSAVKILFYDMCSSVLSNISALISGIESLINKIPGVNVNLSGGLNNLLGSIKAKKAAEMANSGYTEVMKVKDAMSYTDAFSKGYNKGSSFGSGLKNLGKINKNSGTAAATLKGMGSLTDATTGNGNSGKGSGGKAVKTTSTDKNLLSDEDIKLLLDVATRDYKLNYQQVTPSVTVTFGDVRETTDVDLVMDRVADKLEEIYDGNLEV